MSIIIIDREIVDLEGRSIETANKISAICGGEDGKHRNTICRIVSESFNEMVDEIERWSIKENPSKEEPKKSSRVTSKHKQGVPLTAREKLDRIKAAIENQAFDQDANKKIPIEEYDPFGKDNINEKLALIILNNGYPALTGYPKFPRRIKEKRITRFIKRIARIFHKK